MRRKKKDKNNINNQEEIDLIPIESQQEETEVDTQPDAEPENPEATAEDISDASLETETEVESIKPEAESAEPESPEVAAEDTSAQPETPEEESESSALFGAYVAEENKWERKNRIKDEKIKAKQEKKRAKYADVDDVAFNTGMHVQGFPEYGPERMGAPITAYNRIGESEIRVHSNIYHPDYVVVVDETLLHSVDVTNGLKEDGAIVINTPRPKEEILPLLNGYKGSVYTIDAHKVSMETLGKYFPNSPMLAAIVKVADIMDKDVFLSQMQASYEHKFAKKPEVIDGNMRALKMAFEEVK